VRLYTIGIGDPDGGASIPIEKTVEHRTYLHYQGQEVRSRMQQSLLQELAHLTGGVYMPVGTSATTIVGLYTAHIAPKARRHIEAGTGESLVPRYHWFVLAALLLLATEMLVQEKAPEE
jgi:Ca-activated chloride channel homolog